MKSRSVVELPARRLIEKVEEGFPLRELERLARRLEISPECLARRLGISRATFHRRKGRARLASDESDRLVRYSRLMARAVSALDGEEAARRWLNSPQFGLGGAVPLDFARTEVGAREVEDLLGRIEFSVYS